MSSPLTPAEADTRSAVRGAMLTSGVMIAYQVAGKATRDAFFLTAFDVTSLSGAVIGSAAVSVVFVLIASRLMSRLGPARLVPMILVTSAVLLMAEWAIARQSPKIAAAAVYLHFNALGALLISAFWSIVSERFDPRTAKQHVGGIGAAGTLGGLVGGILAERVGSLASVTMMLPVLAVIHLVAVGTIRGLTRRGRTAFRTDEHRSPVGKPSPLSPWVTLVRIPYLRSLIALVVLASVTEGLVDFVFKARAVGSYGRGSDLIRLFAIYYTLIQVLTFAVQAGLTRRALESLGLARTVAALPATVGTSAIGLLFAPGFATAAIVRGIEAILHNSLYRSAYELLFTPIARDQKRATKPLVDVGGNRLGDALGAGVVQAALAFGPLAASRVLPLAAIVTAAATVLLALHLHQAYLRALEKSLLARAVQIDLPDVEDSTTRTAFLSTMGSLGVALPLQEQAAHPPVATPEASDRFPRGAAVFDGEIEQIAALKSGDVSLVHRALRTPLDRKTIAHAIPLLAWDEVAPDVGKALRGVAPRATGQLVDALLDPDEEFGVRRRIPAILATVSSPRATNGLVLALADTRFEVRYRAGRALVRKRSDHAIPDAEVFAAVLREANVGQTVWESQRLLDRTEEDGDSPFVDDFLRERANRSLEHVFTLLSLVFPPQPLSVAFRGLYTDDPLLRGTALEYLESLLPPAVKEKLWPFLGDARTRDRPSRPRTEVLADLLRSHQSIAVNLEKLRGKLDPGEPDPGLGS